MIVAQQHRAVVGGKCQGNILRGPVEHALDLRGGVNLLAVLVEHEQLAGTLLLLAEELRVARQQRGLLGEDPGEAA